MSSSSRSPDEKSANNPSATSPRSKPSWGKIPASEKQIDNIAERVLDYFWAERIEKKQKTYKIDSFKEFCLYCYKDKAIEIEKAFDAIEKYDKKTFIGILKNIITPEDAIAIDKANKFGITHYEENKINEVSDENREDLKQYIEEQKLSAVVTVGNAESKKFVTVTSENADSAALYAMHSVAKAFTQVLLLKLTADKTLDENILNTSIKQLIADSAWSALPKKIQEHLDKNQITLYQLMLHEGAIEDFMPQYRDAIYKSVTDKSSPPKIDNVQDFLKFADSEPVPQFLGKDHYSNLGITLVGLAIEDAYQKKFSSNPLNFYEVLNKTILTPAGIDKQDFVIDGASQKERCRFNQDDPTALYLAGGPAGCYWVTINVLEKYMIWLYNECQKKEFMSLVKKYGQEFYNDKTLVIQHSGHMSCHKSNTEAKADAGASAVFSLDLPTGNSFAAMSDQSTGAALDLDPVVRKNIFVSTEKSSENTSSSSNPFSTTLKPSGFR